MDATTPYREIDAPSDRFRVRWFDQLPSTNDYALEAGRVGEAAGLVVIADHQTEGRGRLGRKWETEPGAALLGSLLLRPEGGVHDAHRYTTVVAVALMNAVEKVTGVRPQLKWPNDLVWQERKLAGVLTEFEDGPNGYLLVVGAGTNVSPVAPEYATLAVSCEELKGTPVDREALLRAWLESLHALLDEPDVALDAARRDSATLKKKVRAELSEGEIVGIAVDLSRSGGLVVETAPGTTTEVTAGDVVHLHDA